ncbi:hypothetical protein Tco_0826668 [Tanacetum coccineum]
MYFKYSTSLIHPKKGRCRAAHEGKTTVTPQKPTKPKNKPSKKKQVLRDESAESEREPYHRPNGRKKRTPKVVIQEPLSVPRAIKASRHESRFQHQTGGSSEGVGLIPEVPDELTGKSADSDEGVGTSPEVPDELEDKSEPRDDLDDWGSTDEEEYLLAYKDKKPKDIPWQSTKDEEYENDDEEDESDEDKSIDIKKSDDERTDTDDEDTVTPHQGKNARCNILINITQDDRLKHHT